MKWVLRILPRIFKSLVPGLLVFLLVLSPLPFGSKPLWAMGPVLIIVFSAYLLFSYGLFSQKKIPYLPTSLNFGWILVALCILILLQILPAPVIIYKFLSAERYDILMNTLPVTLSWYPLSFHPTQTFQYLILYSGYVLFYILILHLCAKPKTALSLALLISFMGLFEALYGLLEHFSGRQAIFGYKNFNAATGVLANVATGTFINPNHYGNYLSVCFFITVGLIGLELSKNKIEGLGWKKRLFQFTSESSAKAFFLMGICSIIALAIFFSESRGAVINLIVGFMCFISLICQKSRFPWKYVAFISMFFIVLNIFLLWIGKGSLTNQWAPMLKDSFLGESFRLTIWQDTLTLFSKFPLLGVGADTFESVYPLYQSTPNVHIPHAHNDYVQALAEYGSLWLALITFCVLRVHTYLKILKEKEHHPNHYIAFGAFAACFSFLIHCIFEFNFHIPANVFIFLTAVAISTLPLQSESKRQEDAPFRKDKTIRFPKWAQLLLIIFSIYSILFCYHISKADWYLFKVEQGQGRNDNGKIIELLPEKAEDLLNHSLLYNKNNVKALYRKARLIQTNSPLKRGVSTKEHLEEVEKYLSLAQRLDPLNHNIHLHLSQLYKKFSHYYEKLRMREEAERFARKAITELQVAKRLAPALSRVQNKKLE